MSDDADPKRRHAASASSFQPFQRDTVDDRAAWRREIETECAPRPDATPAERLQLYGRLGELLRIGGKAGPAAVVLHDAVKLAEQLKDEPAYRANVVRLATAHMYCGRHDDAAHMLEAIMRRIENSANKAYLDFAVQHLGKVHAEKGRWARAIECFTRALELRQDKPDLLASSQRALDEANERSSH